MASIRFVRTGTTPLYLNNQTTSRCALAPVPAGMDDPNGYSNLNVNADSDPIPVRQYSECSVTLYSDTTCVASLQVFVGDTPTGPWVGIGSASANPSLAAPILVNPFSGGRASFVKVTTTGYASGNPRATLTGITKNGAGVP